MQIADFQQTTGTVGLALAGGGPEGAIYEIGVLRALDDALDGLDLNDVPITVGVSSGAFVGASLANGITTAQLVRSVVGEEPGEHPFRPDLFLSPALGEYARRALRVPGLVAEAVFTALRHPRDSSGLVSTLVDRLGRALPVGVFDNAPLRSFLRATFEHEGRTDDFRRLRNRLVVVATDLDSSETVLFGEPGYDDVPISRAVQASTALPGLYPPVEIGGRHYVDGVLNKTVHASVAFEGGAGLVLCVNPIVPVDTARAVATGAMRRGRLVDRGMPGVMSQTLRTLVHSRMGTGMASYRGRYEGADLVLFEPPKDDYTMFFTNVFSFAARKEIVAHAYASTLAQLRDRAGEVGPVFARHGITLRTDVLTRPQFDVWESVGLAAGRPLLPSTVATRDLHDALADLEEVLRTRAA
ncbi:patatin-like phospholipase family protein [Rubrivirga litoralis]|uniref:Patatin-like phospholipase family protein n=1 Tax=Rubrivirga litoralis TaxID=3075598 RepID=A0ABU3BT60_9BACT|nr:patatin-like phospholipase family protein [Rubrivirga sp. F394]MDT0632467.1 patatin-like phospholipase family protein [Rubrivirga sp. F394]